MIVCIVTMAQVTSTFEKLSIQCNAITESLISGDLATVYFKHIIYGAELVLPRIIWMKTQITANATLNFRESVHENILN